MTQTTRSSATHAPPPESSLREKVLKGGFALILRQGCGLFLSLLGVFVVTRVIGPSEYGLYAASLGLITFCNLVGVWGLDVYLIRKPEPPTLREFHQVFTLLLGLSALFGGGLFVAREAIAQALNLPAVAPIIGVMALSLPLTLLTIPATVKLDRSLNFHAVAYIELLSQASYYLVAIPFALKGLGAWAPVLGFLVQQYVLLNLSYWHTRYSPRLCWDQGLVQSMLGYGFSYSSSIWVWQLRSLINPVIVGRFAGAEAVAFVAVAIRLAEMLAFVKNVTWRLAMASLAKLGENKTRLRQSIEEGMRLQVLTVGLPMAGFALVGTTLLPLLFGAKWNPVLGIFPFIAASYLTNALFNLHSSVLYLLQRNGAVTVFHVVHMVLFAGAAWWLVPRWGGVGYGWAEAIAFLSYGVIHQSVVRAIGRPDYRLTLPWYAAAIAGLVLSSLNHPLRYFACLVLLLPLISERERTSLGGYVQILTRKGA